MRDYCSNGWRHRWWKNNEREKDCAKKFLSGEIQIILYDQAEKRFPAAPYIATAKSGDCHHGCLTTENQLYPPAGSTAEDIFTHTSQDHYMKINETQAYCKYWIKTPELTGWELLIIFIKISWKHRFSLCNYPLICVGLSHHKKISLHLRELSHGNTNN